MQKTKPDLSPIALPRGLIYTTALTCGVLAALALQIYLTRSGYDLVGLWANVFSTKSMQLRTAGPWWAIAGLAFVVSGAVAAALSRLPLPWRRFRLLRWALGAVIVLGLADIGHSASLPEGIGAGANVAASIGALVIAALMAMFGAYFTVRR
ncbi:MAG TPA: hypothetical protein VKD43_07430 [Xanthobacteraceae bacterium]|nr:hypothetical protein [Xanthobacteraceae bacterium]